MTTARQRATRQVNEAPARFASALRVLGADVCVPESAMVADRRAASHLFAADDSTVRMCAPTVVVREPFVLSGSEVPTCARCRRKYDAATATIDVAFEDYEAIRGECIGEPDSITLDDVDPVVRAYAHEWAKRQNKPWPPPPVNDFGAVTIMSSR